MIVTTFNKTFALSAVATLALVSSLSLFPADSARAASAEIFDIDPSLQSRIAREKIKQRGPRRGAGDRSGDSDNCGQVNIGNNDNNRNGRSRVNPRVNVTVVQGPVLNVARCR